MYNFGGSLPFKWAHGQCRRSARTAQIETKSTEVRFGKLWLDVIHVILLKPLQYFLSHILQTR